LFHPKIYTNRKMMSQRTLETYIRITATAITNVVMRLDSVHAIDESVGEEP